MSTQQQIALEPTSPVALLKKPVWDNPTSRRNEPFWICETIFGTASIHQKSDGTWRLHGDFISRIPDDDEEYKGFGINKIDQSRVYDNQDPDVLKTVIDNLHITQLEKFLDLIPSVQVPSDIDAVKKESGLVKFNCNLKYSSKDCDYTTTFNTSKNPPHQVVIDVIEHLGWMAALDGDAKPALAALYQGIERGGTRAIELASIRTPKTEVHPDDLAIDAIAALMKQKMADGRAKGRGGWEDPIQCDSNTFAKLIAGNLLKDNEGNLIDLAILLMMFAHHGGKATQILSFLQFPDKEMGTFEHHGVTFDTNQPYVWVSSIEADFSENFNGHIENQGVFFTFKGKYTPFGDKNIITQLNFSNNDDTAFSADLAIEMTVVVANTLSKLMSHRTDLLEFKDQQIASIHADIEAADKKYRIAGESEFYESVEELLARNDLEPIGTTEIECFAMLERPSLYAYVKQNGNGGWENVLVDEDYEDA